VEDFKKAQNGILIGMESFGEGIDIPGDLLEFIYIDKVPDLRQDLVIQKRRDFYDANFGNEFNDYFLAHRTRALHQKLGRLIRRESDKGCIIVTDSRLARWKGRTLETFKDMMKPYKLNVTTMDEACNKTREFLI
jgi:ATP-dependent DNA helicase DinG